MVVWSSRHHHADCRYAPQQLAITIITLEKILRGWYTQVRRAPDNEQLTRAYQALQETVEFTRGVQILPFDRPTIQRYRSLRTHHRRSGTNDLRIAEIALEQGAILVTRNISDFVDITDLQLEDWTVKNLAASCEASFPRSYKNEASFGASDP